LQSAKDTFWEKCAKSQFQREIWFWSCCKEAYLCCCKRWGI